jgi:transcription-repair coupling factor (superfamily II helicase)
VFLKNFISERQWQKFIELYKKEKAGAGKEGGISADTLIADEDVWPFIISGFRHEFKIPALIITSTLERACELENEIKCVAPGTKILSFASLGSGIFYKNKPTSPGNLASRLQTIKYVVSGSRSISNLLIVAPSNSLVNLMASPEVDKLETMTVKAGGEHERDKLIDWLVKSGYERVNQVYDRGEFSIRGEVIDVFDTTCENPVRMDFFGDTAEKIFFYEISNQKLKRKIKKISIFPNINPWEIKEENRAEPADKMISFIDLLRKNIKRFALILCDPLEIYLKVKSDIDILNRSLDRDKDILITDNIKVIRSHLVREDFLERGKIEIFFIFLLSF